MKTFSKETFNKIARFLAISVVVAFVAYTHIASSVSAQSLGGTITKTCVKKKYVVATQEEASRIRQNSYSSEVDCNAARSGINLDQTVAFTCSG